jgi:Domain of unknown function (DUF932)
VPNTCVGSAGSAVQHRRHDGLHLGGALSGARRGPTIAPIAGTRWAAYNAVSEYVDHLDGAFVYEIS